MKEEDGFGVMNWSERLCDGDLWSKDRSEIGDSNLTILNSSNRHVYLYRLWTVRRPFLLNNGFVCSFSKNSLPRICSSIQRVLAHD